MNQIHHGDVLDVLARLPIDSVHTVCTSPPYYNQRDYDHDGQIGGENTVGAYIDNLVDVSQALARVCRDDGSFLLNVGDVYIDKQRQFVPHRLARSIVAETDFQCRQELVWNKEQTKPDPASDRRCVDHEYIFHFVQDDDYWYDETVSGGGHSSVVTAPTANSSLDHLAVYSEELVEELLTGVAPPMVCDRCWTPYNRAYESVPRPFCDPDRQQAVRAAELYDDSSLTPEHIDAIRAVGISDVGKASQTEDGAGRNKDHVEQMAAEAKEVLGGYYREFTMVEAVPTGFKQRCDCDGETIAGVVCDPFVGSGTTTKMAREHGYRYVGIDINEQYVDIATARTKEGGDAS